MIKLKRHAAIPIRAVGPIKISGEVNEAVTVPLATLESPLWPSVSRGARVSRECAAGIQALILREGMTRSILLEAPNAHYAATVIAKLADCREELAKVVASSSRYARLKNWHTELVGNLLYIRFCFQTGDAAGHNITTKAADALLTWILGHYQSLHYVSVSGNYCVDKKVSAINGILGRGKQVVADILIPEEICRQHLKTTPVKIVDLHIKKNLIGSVVAGGVRTANAHFANMLAAAYLATGQDVANIVEGSQGMVHAEVRNQALYFSVTIPNIIVGTVGSSKDLTFVQESLELLGCCGANAGKNSRRLALIIGATILCGELSLLAAQTNQGELTRGHVKLERK